MTAHARWLHPATLEGEAVRLEPLAFDNVDDLWAVADHPGIWTWMSFNVTSRDEVAGLVAVALEWPATDWGQAFVQRTRVNTEAKLLLMRHAFDHLGANRVEWKTDSENVRSREAFIRLGATEEGTLRNHMVRPDGSMRHSTCFSVIREEWPRVEQHVEGLLAGHSSP